jgi:hypothetical protein
MTEEASTPEVTTESTATESTATESTILETKTEATPIAPTVEDFKELISEDIRGQSNIGDFKSIDDFAKSYIESQKLLGRSVRLPSEDSSPEARDEFLSKIKDIDGVLLKGDENLHSKLGKPESKDSYDFSEQISEDLLNKIPDLTSELDQFKDLAFDANLTTEQANRLVDNRLKTLEKLNTEYELNKNKSIESLKKRWGSEYDNRVESAKKVAKIYAEKFGPEVEALVNSSAGNNPVVLEMLNDLAGMYSEKGHTGMQGSSFGMTPESAASKIAEKRGDTGFMKAYTDQFHPEHKKAVQELSKLYQIANS